MSWFSRRREQAIWRRAHQLYRQYLVGERYVAGLHPLGATLAQEQADSANSIRMRSARNHFYWDERSWPNDRPSKQRDRSGSSPTSYRFEWGRERVAQRAKWAAEDAADAAEEYARLNDPRAD